MPARNNPTGCRVRHSRIALTPFAAQFGTAPHWKAYAEVIDEQILTPLNLNNTYAPIDSALPDPHPRGYEWPIAEESLPLPADWGTPVAQTTPVTSTEAIDVTHYNASFMLGSTNMVSTLDDLNVWINAVIDGTLLSEDMHKEQMTALPEGSPEYPGTDGYGLGIVEMKPYWGHNGMVKGFHSLTARHMSEPLSIVMVANAFATADNSVVYTPVLQAITGQGPGTTS